jgi:hypothetical protein
MHGGVGSSAAKGERNGNYRHGASTKDGLFLMRDLNMLAKMV